MRVTPQRYVESAQLAVWLPAVVLALIGVALIHSASSGSRFLEIAGHSGRQLGWFTAGGLAMAAAMALPFSLYDGGRSYVAWGVGIALLVLVLFVGKSGLGAQRWLEVGGVRVQPAELAKLATIIALARFLGGRRRDIRQLRQLAVAAVLGLAPAILVLRQPDLGTSLVFPAITIGMLYWAGVPFPYLLLLLSPLFSLIAASSPWAWAAYAVFLVVGLHWAFTRYRASWALLALVTVANLAVGVATPKIWASLEGYQRERITAFLDPGRHRFGAGYQLIQSQIAIGAGGVFGQGYQQGTQKKLQFLPEKHTDFVFSVAGEEFGLVGCSVILGLYCVLLLGVLEIARRARSRFASLVSIGLGTMVFFQVLVNVAMTVGLAPVTGLPLPLLSYGGSSLTMTLFGLGMVTGMGVRRHEY